VANPEKLLEMENVTLVLECEDALLKAQWKTTWKNAKKRVVKGSKLGKNI
jgi:hypothetical protein